MRLVRALSAVLSAFLGIRKARGAAGDVRLPLSLLFVAIVLLVALFIGGLLLLVRLVVS